jgi:hypothetical protein
VTSVQLRHGVADLPLGYRDAAGAGGSEPEFESHTGTVVGAGPGGAVGGGISDANIPRAMPVSSSWELAMLC